MTKPDFDADPDPMTLAGIDLLARTGATSFELRYSDETPIVWTAVVCYERERGSYWDAASGMTPRRAVMRLCELMIDGGTCAHCKRPSGFTDDFDQMPADEFLCWYQWDPELKVFRRGCTGA